MPRSGRRALVRRLTAVVLCAWAASTSEAAESVWDALRAPGTVVVLRHSYAPGGFDPPDARFEADGSGAVAGRLYVE